MSHRLEIDVVTIFPGMLEGFVHESIIKRAIDSGRIRVGFVNLRDFTTDTHRTTDDRPYGGGPGMVMIAGRLFEAEE